MRPAINPLKRHKFNVIIKYTSETSPPVSSPDTAPAPESATTGAYHSPEISPAEAQAINDNFNIAVYGCTHGVPELGEGDQDKVDNAYNAVVSVVDALVPANGDKLFELGHDSIARTILEGFREQRTVDPLTYAVSLARINGVPVITADMHLNTTQQFEHITGAPIPMGFDPDWHLFGIYNTLRNEQTAAIVKDEALAALPHLAGRRPTYALLMGPGHTNAGIANSVSSTSVPEIFQNMGLQAKTEQLPHAYETAAQKIAQPAESAALLGAISGPHS